LKPGDVVLGKYTLSKCTGDDGNVVTYLANDTFQKAVVEANVISYEKASNAVVTVKDLRLGTVKNRQQLFEREAATRQSLDHPRIPKHVDIGFESGRMLLVYEMTDSPSLAELIRRGVRFDEIEVEQIARELLAILKYLANRRFSPSCFHTECSASLVPRWHCHEVHICNVQTYHASDHSREAQCGNFRSCRPPLMHTHLTPENVYLDPHRRSVQLVDVGFVQQDKSAQDTDNTDGAAFADTAGFLHRRIIFSETYLHARVSMCESTVCRILCVS
jgi:serine/threonine protein kinase